MKLIVFTRPDGGISIVKPNISGEDIGMTEAEALKRVVDRLPTDLRYAIVEPSNIPTDRTSRNAWKLDNGVVSIDPDRLPK